MDNSSKGIWIGVAVVIILALIGWWWLASAPPAGMMGANTATSTTTGTGTAPVKYPVSHSSSNVASIAESISDATKFASVFQSTGVAATIKPGSTNHYTIFVPTDGAFSLLPSGTISGMSSAQLKRLVQYHVVSGRAIDASAQFSGSVQALSGDALNFSDTTTNIPMVNSSIIVAEYDGSNGVVYVINGVLLPPQKVQ